MNLVTIVVPLDGSPLAEAALPYAEALAHATGAALQLLSVVPMEPGEPQISPLAVRTGFVQVDEDQLNDYLQVTKSALQERGLQVFSSLLRGEPADEIVAAADGMEAAIVVMATHGRGGLQRWLIGSVADRVMRMGTRPTLLIRPPKDLGTKQEPVELKRLLVPLDGSPLAEAAIPLATELAAALGATLTLVRVEPWIAERITRDEFVPNLSEIEAEAEEAAKIYLEEVRRRIPDAVPSESVVLRGPATVGLIDFARQTGIDLVVMSTHGWGGVRRFVLGSTADRLVRAGVPTLLIRPRAARPLATQDVLAAQPARHCAACGRLITFVVHDESRCPRCQTHLHTCANCLFWDGFICMLQRPEAHDLAWAGRSCEYFLFRETPSGAQVAQARESH